MAASSAAITISNTDGTCTANLSSINNGQVSGFRNFLINGAMQHNQRVDTGTLGYFNPVTTSIYTLDRWRFFTGDSFDTNSARITQDSASPNGFSNSWKMDIFNTQTPTSGQNAGVEQKIEAQNLQGLGYGTSAAKTMTLSFYVKSFKTGTYCVQIFQSDPLKYQLHEYTISQSNVWERKTITIVGNTSDAINNDNGIGLRIAWHLVAGSGDHASATSSWVSGSSFKATSNQVNLWDNSNNDWFLTGCQLEIGTVATDFEHRLFSQELFLCQRYYEVLVSGQGKTWGGATVMYQDHETHHQINYIEKRGTPTLDYVSGTNYYKYYGNGADANSNTLDQFLYVTSRSAGIVVNNLSANLLAGGAAFSYTNNASCFVAISAEL